MSSWLFTSSEMSPHVTILGQKVGGNCTTQSSQSTTAAPIINIEWTILGSLKKNMPTTSTCTYIFFLLSHTNLCIVRCYIWVSANSNSLSCFSKIQKYCQLICEVILRSEFWGKWNILLHCHTSATSSLLITLSEVAEEEDEGGLQLRKSINIYSVLVTLIWRYLQSIHVTVSVSYFQVIFIVFIWL